MFGIQEGYSYTTLGYDDPSWGPTAQLLHPRVMEKLAGESYVPQRIIDFMANCRPREDGRYILLNALGAGEYWGSNRNGDYFPEWSLKGDPPPPHIEDFIRRKGLPMPSEWGYKTFERWAYPYRHHLNHDPVHSIGERVCCAAYNERMHRVELIIFIFTAKAKDIVDRLDKGDPIPWSMGAKLMWDVCSICHNAARNRNEYCAHLKTMLNRILPDGSKVFAYNYFPRFFDISEIAVPADRSAYSLKKVAGFMESGEAEAIWVPGQDHVAVVPSTNSELDKYAGLIEYLTDGGEKSAEIEKEVPAQEPSKNLGPSPAKPEFWNMLWNLISEDRGSCHPIPSSDLVDLKNQHPLEKILSALTSLGIVLRPEEIGTLSGGDEKKIPQDLDFSDPDSTILGKLKGLVGSRSMFDPHFSIRVVRITKKVNDEPPKSIALVGRTGPFNKYMDLLRNRLDLDKLSEAVAHPRVQLALDPSFLEKEILGLGKEGERLTFEDAVIPFIAAVSSK